jgi:TetR/AcrR family transcriptional regulator
MGRKKRAPSPEWAEARAVQLRLKREAVLRAASELLNEKGYAATSLADVAARLNMTNNALYYYFKSKGELAYQCFVRAQAVIDECLESADKEGTSGLEKVELFVRNALRSGRQYGVLPSASQSFALGAAHQRALSESDQRHRATLARFIEEGIRDGSIRNCEAGLVTTMIIGALYAIPGQLRRRGPAPRRPARQPLSEEIVDFVRHCLLPKQRVPAAAGR